MLRTILFVDDEPEVLALLRRTFPARDGFETLAASSGEQALGILAAHDVEVLVTDQRMGGMTGTELAAEAHRRLPELCTVLLTAHTDPDELVDAINRGQVFRYLVKPWETAELKQAVLSALEHAGLRRERARLQAELERRLAALQIASEIAREVGAAETPAALLERVVARLPEIVPCDVAAALLAPPAGAPALLVRSRGGLSEPMLRAVREETLSATGAAGGRPVDPGALEVRLVLGGEGPGPEALAARLTVPVVSDGATTGAVVLARAEAHPFSEGDARVLDVLVNEVAEALRAFAARLGRERLRLERVVESLADGLLFLPQDGADVVANPAARRMLAAPAGPITRAFVEDALGFSPFGVARPTDADGTVRAVAVDELRRGDRTFAPIVSTVPDARGRITGVAVVLRDVTEQKRLEERKEEFVHVVSHELRTPLTSITGALDLVLGGLVGPLEPKQERYLKMARDSTERLNAVVDDILDVARLAGGKLRMELQPCSLEDLVRSAAESFQAAAAERRLELSLEPAGAPVRAQVDPDRIGQVLANLLSNAVKFSPEGGQVRLRSFVGPVRGLSAFSIWNGGEGIPEADLDRIFEKFEQARTAQNRRVRGTGLGLAICRGLVEAHGGRIWAESAPGQGVRLVVVLPEQPPPAAAEERRRRPARATAVVVAEPDAAALCRAVLEARGFACRTATGSEEALELVRRLRPRLLVWDPGCAALAGVPLPELLRRDPDGRQVRVLAFGAPAQRERALAAGADAFLERPALAAAFGDAAEALEDQPRPERARVGVVDDDPAIRAICAEVLASHGFQVHEAGSCAEARELVRTRRPEALLLDVQLPDGDGFDLLEALAEERVREPFAAVFLSARAEAEDRARGLGLGADAFIKKPFDARDLLTRLEHALARREGVAAAAPAIRLPDRAAYEAALAARLAAGAPFAVSTFALDNLKAFEEHQGRARAEGTVFQLAALLQAALEAGGGAEAFLGHLGGDDFSAITDPDAAGPVCKMVVEAFDQLTALYYERADRERGSLEAADRFGNRRRFPVLALSAVTVRAAPGRFAEPAELARAAEELRRTAPARRGSAHLDEQGGVAT